MSNMMPVLVETRPGPFFGDQEVVVAEKLEFRLAPFVGQGPRDDPECLTACRKSGEWREAQKTARLAEIARQVQAREDEGRKALAARRNRAQIRHQELQLTASPTCQASRGNTITGVDCWGL